MLWNSDTQTWTETPEELKRKEHIRKPSPLAVTQVISTLQKTETKALKQQKEKREEDKKADEQKGENRWVKSVSRKRKDDSTI